MTRRAELEAFIKRHLDFTDEKIDYTSAELLQLVNEAKDLIKSEPTLLEVKLPVFVVGDVHGQFKDLRRIFISTGNTGVSGAHARRYLFLGDYVDRGKNSLECISLLLAYKLAFPRMYNLLRGNHESAAINRVYGFYQELHERFVEDEALQLWRAFNELFAYLPLAAIIQGRILCMHGGISPHLNTLDDIRNIRRPLDDPNSNQLACDLLWSDPMVDLTGFLPNTVRGVSVYFGEDAVLKICEKLKLDLIVRAHQMMLNGYGFFCKRKLVTIFSAPRYYPEKNNKGAVMTVNKSMRIGFIIMNPSNLATKGEEKFRENFTRLEEDPSYMSRTQSLDSTMLASVSEDKLPPPAFVASNKESAAKTSESTKKGKKSTS